MRDRSLCGSAFWEVQRGGGLGRIRWLLRPLLLLWLELFCIPEDSDETFNGEKHRHTILQRLTVGVMRRRRHGTLRSWSSGDVRPNASQIA